MITTGVKKHFLNDELETAISDSLTHAGIRFKHSSEKGGQRLDFHLPDYDVYIEVKKYHSDRSNSQLSSQDNVILAQGREAVYFLCKLLKGETQ